MKMIVAVLAVALAVLASVPPAATQQTEKVYRIGYLAPVPLSSHWPRAATFPSAGLIAAIAKWWIDHVPTRVRSFGSTMAFSGLPDRTRGGLRELMDGGAGAIDP